MPEKLQDLAPLQHFLREQRERVQNAMRLPAVKMPEVHVVLGNESADLDSIISAIVRAYHLSLTDKKGHLYLPYINIPREEIKLRKDTQYLFESLGIAIDDLSFIDDSVTLDALNNKQKLKLHLVDHNELNPEQRHLANSVVDIVDHHADANIQYPQLTHQVMSVIGSCSSLVANEFLKEFPITHMPKSLASLLLAPILIDTGNLKSNVKTTPEDIRIAKLLKARAGELLPDNYYDTLLSKKADTTGFSNQLLLLKDFKKFQAEGVVYGMSTLVSSETFSFENLAKLLPDFESLTQKKGLDFLVLLMPYGEVRDPGRRIVIFSKHAPMVKVLATNQLLNGKAVTVENSSDNVIFYRSAQHISRKQLQPSISELLHHELRPVESNVSLRFLNKLRKDSEQLNDDERDHSQLTQ